MSQQAEHQTALRTKRAKTPKRLSVAMTGKLIEATGGVNALASMMDISTNAVFNWKRRGMPKTRVMILRSTFRDFAIMKEPEIAEM